MTQTVEVDVKELVLSQGNFGAAEVEQLRQAVGQDFSYMRTLREAVQQLETQADKNAEAKLGVCSYLLGRYRLATEHLTSASGGLAKYYLGRSYHAQEKYDEALEAYTAAARSGHASDACALAKAETLRVMGRAAESLQVLDKLSGAVEQTAEYLYQRGATVGAIGGNPQEVVALFERAVDVDGGHTGALFGLALESDRRGNDEDALRLLERSIAKVPPNLGALMNLGLIYEDRGQFDRARQCYMRVLDIYPNHARARLYFKDASAGGETYMDEDAQRRRDRLSQILGIPVTDFELSVRSRNCLQKMGIHTLGDLAATSEQELLASKNFGETSLVEIKDLLTAKGLSLGQLAGERVRHEVVEQQSLSPDEQAMFNKPIADLNLSVRARKCMIRLNIATVGELLRHTGDELLECKNFGVTSLNEVREKLTTMGIKLRGD